MRATTNSRSNPLNIWFTCVVLLLAACTISVNAQTTVGRISGTVTDASGGSVPNATVTATNSATNLVR
ncbi:MAG: carboxypeptidase-like regulatory domain-containing protein, partial [Pyrinomonadaceae bacterium]